MRGLVLRFQSHFWPNFDVHGKVFHDVDVVVVFPHIRHLHQLLIIISLSNHCCHQDQVDTDSVIQDNGNLEDDKMPSKGCLNPEGRIVQLKRIAILNVDWGLVHEHSKRWFHH